MTRCDIFINPLYKIHGVYLWCIIIIIVIVIVFIIFITEEIFVLVERQIPFLFFQIRIGKMLSFQLVADVEIASNCVIFTGEALLELKIISHPSECVAKFPPISPNIYPKHFGTRFFSKCDGEKHPFRQHQKTTPEFSKVATDTSHVKLMYRCLCNVTSQLLNMSCHYPPSRR